MGARHEPRQPGDDNVAALPNRCRCAGEVGQWADTSACSVHDNETSPLAQSVRQAFDKGRIAALEQAAERWRDALDFLCGGIDREPWTTVYRNAGGGYEGLQAVAREALEGDWR